MPRASKDTQYNRASEPSTQRPDTQNSRNLGDESISAPTQHTFEPAVDWKLFQSLAMPGENVSFSLINGDGTFIDCTPGCENVWGLTHHQLKDQDIFAIISEDSRLKNWLGGSLNQGQEDQIFRATVSRLNKRPIEVNLRSIPIYVSSEPSESRIVIKAVVHEDYPAKQLFPLSATLSSIHDKHGNFISANSCWEEVTGIPLDQIQEHSLQTLASEQDKAKAKNFIYDTVKNKEAQTKVLRVNTDSNRVQSILATANLDSKGEKVSIEAKNITVQTESIPTDLLKISIELIKESVIILSKAGRNFRISYVNKAFEELTQYNGSCAIGGNTNFLNGPKTNALASLSIEESLDNETEHSVDILFYRKDGSTFWSKTHLSPISNENGDTNHFIAILEDTTQAKETATELEQTNIELKTALTDLQKTQKAIIQQENLRALGQMASGIAHDFNNLLAPILGFSELLLTIPADSRDEQKLVAYLQKIQVAAQDGAAVVGRLREFYRSQSNKDEFTDINPDELICQVRELTRHRWKNQAEGRGVNIQLITECTTKSCIRGNESELRQVLTNLVINAVDAMDENGSIAIKVKDVDSTTQITVSDTGHGMSDEIKKKCLDPFYTTKGKLGTGLGLSIVLGVIQRHDGEFKVDSKQGVGTTITMNLPSHNEMLVEEETSERASVSNKSLRILLIDDEEILLEVISELLGSGGHIVDNFAEPKSALEQFKSAEYDLVITDRAMPGMSGDQLAAAMKSIHPEIPIFMVTGFGDLIKETGEMPPNIDEVLGKPLPLDVLNLKLAELLNKKK